jgi:hypothetical protein
MVERFIEVITDISDLQVTVLHISLFVYAILIHDNVTDKTELVRRKVVVDKKIVQVAQAVLYLFTNTA